MSYECHMVNPFLLVAIYYASERYAWKRNGGQLSIAKENFGAKLQIFENIYKYFR